MKRIAALLAATVFAGSCVLAEEARDAGFEPLFDGKTLQGWHASAKEVALEMNNDFGPDSGLFLRSTEEGRCYQAMIDYHDGGNLMGIYGEGLGGKPHVRNFSFLNAPEKITIVSDVNGQQPPVAFPIREAEWPTLWKHGRWNELRARIVGNPPMITTWINGVKFMEWTDTQKRLPDTGGIAVQVHGGGDLTKQFVRYRNVRVKKLGASEK